ncbi:MAG: hypothetical protein ACRD96_16555, partial [Bryobacteraceae bacterium]
MAENGRLIALDGTGGAGMAAAAKRLQRASAAGRNKAGVSGWDASGLFFELGRAGRQIHPASPRTMVLVYASDLLFRLRWEIRPLLAAGRSVIAAPYVE